MRELSIADFRQLTEGEKIKPCQRISLPQSPSVPAPSSEGARIGAPTKLTDKLEFTLLTFSVYVL